MDTITLINDRITMMTNNSIKIKQLSKQIESLLKEEFYDEEAIALMINQIECLRSDNIRIKKLPLFKQR